MYQGAFVLFYPTSLLPTFAEVTKAFSLRTGIGFDYLLDEVDRDFLTIRPVNEIRNKEDTDFYFSQAKDRIFRYYYMGVLYKSDIKEVVHVEVYKYVYHLYLCPQNVHKLSRYFYEVFIDTLVKLGGTIVEEAGFFPFPENWEKPRKKRRKYNWVNHTWDNRYIPKKYRAHKGEPLQEDLELMRNLLLYRKLSPRMKLLAP